MGKEENTKIVFDIVNSVKGGSGKSTVALQLAAFWAFRPDTDAYIIDLDLRGTSWEKTYEHDYSKKSDYINKLMYGFGPEDSIFWHLNVEYTNTVTNETTQKTVHLCIGDPNASGDIDAVKVDLLESAVYEIIKRILAKSNGRKEIHIIFDMPPSYESHAERVVKHLLLDKSSELFLKHNKEGVPKYHVNLLMIYAITAAHVEQDIVYTKNFLKQSVYSSEFSVFLREKKFSLFFLGNDVSGVAGSGGDKANNYPKIRGRVITLLDNAISFDDTSEMMTDLKNKLFVIEHMKMDRNLQSFIEPKKPVKPKLMSEAQKVFEDLFPDKKSKP